MGRSWGAVGILCGVLLAGAAAAEVPAAQHREAPRTVPARVLRESALVLLRDNRGLPVSLHVPGALHRPANAFRLYGARPLTLRDRNRRRDLYRDALLELATRSRLQDSVAAWEPVARQMEWLEGRNPHLRALLQGGDDAIEAASKLSRQLEGLAAYRHLRTVSALLNRPVPVPGLSAPLMETLRLRAVATDEAEQRLAALGRALGVERPGADPALRDGYRLARVEFDRLRAGLWSTLVFTVERHRGRLVAQAVRDLVFSSLGAWALLGHLAWQSTEGALNAEYAGQLAVLHATLAARLEAARGTVSEAEALAPYAEYALYYQLTEALKDGRLPAWKPAGGRSVGEWQLLLGERQRELRAALALPEPAARAAGG